MTTAITADALVRLFGILGVSTAFFMLAKGFWMSINYDVDDFINPKENAENIES